MLLPLTIDCKVRILELSVGYQLMKFRYINHSEKNETDFYHCF